MSYRERLSVPVHWWLIAAFFALSLVVALGAYLGWDWALATALLTTGAVVATLASYSAATLEVTAEELRAGRARIPWRYVRSAEPLDAEATRLSRGRDADASAFYLLRPYLSSAVLVTLDDPRDSHPYWLLSSRRPAALAEAITQHLARQSAGSGKPDR